jgi:hypothetical protein
MSAPPSRPHPSASLYVGDLAPYAHFWIINLFWRFFVLSLVFYMRMKGFAKNQKSNFLQHSFSQSKLPQKGSTSIDSSFDLIDTMQRCHWGHALWNLQSSWSCRFGSCLPWFQIETLFRICICQLSQCEWWWVDRRRMFSILLFCIQSRPKQFFFSCPLFPQQSDFILFSTINIVVFFYTFCIRFNSRFGFFSDFFGGCV